MSFPRTLKTASNAAFAAIEGSRPRSTSHPGLNTIFTRPDGSGFASLRAGWRVLIFAVMVVALLGAFVLIRNGGLEGAREAQRHSGQIVVTPFLMGYSEVIAFALLCFATLVMGKFERRKFGVYGLPLRKALGKDFWIGILAGFGTISGTLLAMFALRVYSITGLALHGRNIVFSLAGWGAAFLLAGLFEEFLCRGYLQYTLASGIGFWPAALAMSCVFAFGHAFNGNENVWGVLSVVLFGLLLSLFLWRTGNLWCAVGFHLAYDWGQTFYGVPDSGIVPYHNLFTSAFSGPRWLTGGIVGPEASVLTPVALLVAGVLFALFYSRSRESEA